METTDYEVTIKEPQYVFVSSYVNEGFKKTLNDLSITEVYEKPITKQKLIKILTNNC